MIRLPDREPPPTQEEAGSSHLSFREARRLERRLVNSIGSICDETSHYAEDRAVLRLGFLRLQDARPRRAERLAKQLGRELITGRGAEVRAFPHPENIFYGEVLGEEDTDEFQAFG